MVSLFHPLPYHAVTLKQELELTLMTLAVSLPNLDSRMARISLTLNPRSPSSSAAKLLIACTSNKICRGNMCC